MQQLGERMKSYEDTTRFSKGAVVIRVDGKAFHTWTRKAKLLRPFDHTMNLAMTYATSMAAREMQGFKLAYTQSDEATFVLMNMGEKEEAWFDGKVQKLASLSASLFTYYFNSVFIWNDDNDAPPAFFDSRAYSVPVEDVANVIVWRQQDNARNWVQSYANSVLPRKEVKGVSNKELKTKLEADGHNLALLPGWVRYGTFIVPGENLPLTSFTDYLDYYDINDELGIKESDDSL